MLIAQKTKLLNVHVHSTYSTCVYCVRIQRLRSRQGAALAAPEPQDHLICCVTGYEGFGTEAGGGGWD